MKTINLEDGKYIIESNAGICKALRYGKEWRDLTGDKLIGALIDKIIELETPNTHSQVNVN
jgi:hypothetical protein